MRLRLAAFLAVATSAFASLDDSLSKLNAVSREGQGNEAASEAWKQVVKTGPEALVPILQASGKGNVIADNWLRLAATVGYSKSEIKTYGVGAGNCLDCNLVWGSFAGVIGNSLPTTPKLTWSLSGDYSAPLTGSLDWYGRADYSVQGSKYTDFSNVAKVGSQENANLRFGLRNARGSIEAFVTNLTDDDTVQAAILGIDAFSFLLPPNKNELRFSPNMPRMYGLRATYNFGATK
mgnify:CR=1 FL=1